MDYFFRIPRFTYENNRIPENSTGICCYLIYIHDNVFCRNENSILFRSTPRVFRKQKLHQKNPPKAFGALLAVGLGIALVMQTMINMAVAVNLLPVTGVTLPLVSMGGSSVIFTSIAFGIILSVSRNIEIEEDVSL